MPDVRSNNINIHYEQQGKGDPLILIMGLGADGSLWEEHVKEYEKHFQCIMMDNRGAGRSDSPEGSYTTEMMAKDTIGLMDTLHMDNARIAGISMGSAVAQNLALIAPEKVRSMVLVSSWARCDIYTKTLFESFKKMRALAKPDDFMELLQLWIFTPRHFEKNISDLVDGQKDTLTDELLMKQHAFEAQCDACSTHDTLDRLGEIKIPSLITVGDADIFTPLRFSKEIHERMENSELLVFPGRGHCHHWEDLEKFNKATTKFLLEH